MDPEKFALDHSVFAGIGALAPGAFVVGSATGDAADRIIYDQINSSLYFDAAGNGAGHPVRPRRRGYRPHRERFQRNLRHGKQARAGRA